jgi:hypothetical protein
MVVLRQQNFRLDTDRIFVRKCLMPDSDAGGDADDIDYLDAFENAPMVPPREILSREGFQPLPPNHVTSDAVAGRLWELLYALAARRFFFHCTDHLSDAELYRFVYEWLEELEPDIPLAAEMNCHVDCSDAGSGGDLWVKYYADDETREMMQRDHPNEILPAKEKPPYDRDRLMPEPPNPFPPGGNGLPEWTGSDVGEEDDPLGLAAVDREIAEAQPTQDESIREDWHRPVDEMKRTGFTPVPPDELTDEAVTPLLWELLHQLSCRGFYVTHTDHLSDMELYRELWTKGIREDSLMPGRRSRTSMWMHDMIGSYGDEEIQIELSYYATDETRERHAKEYPSIPLPEKKAPPFLRDWRLPKAPF